MPSGAAVGTTVERQECAVCCEDVDPSCLLRLPCKHCYHAPCMNRWAEQHAGREVTCPQCREPVSQELLQELQRPLTWIDMMVLPIMLLVLMIQSLHGYLQTGYHSIKNGGIMLMTFSGDTLLWTFELLRDALSAPSPRIVVIMWTAYQKMEDMWTHIRYVLTDGACQLLDELAFDLDMLTSACVFFGDGVRAALCSVLSASRTIFQECGCMSATMGHIVKKVSTAAYEQAAIVSQHLLNPLLAAGRAVQQTATNTWHSFRSILIFAMMSCRGHVDVALRHASHASMATLRKCRRMSATLADALKIACAIAYEQAEALDVVVQGILHSGGKMCYESYCILAPVYASTMDYFHALLCSVSHVFATTLEECGHALRATTSYWKSAFEAVASTAHTLMYSPAAARVWHLLDLLLVAAWAALQMAQNVCRGVKQAMAPVLQRFQAQAAEGLWLLLDRVSAAVQATAQIGEHVSRGILQALTPAIQWFRDKWMSLTYSSLLLLHEYIADPALRLMSFTVQLVCKSAVWSLRFLWACLYSLANSIMEVLISLKMTAYNVIYRPQCSVCQRGCAKLRSLCFTCVGDHLVPRCSDCGQGWCKVQSRCLSCTVDYHFEHPRCAECHQGFKKIGVRCFTCALDMWFSRCSVCQQGYSKLDGSCCLTCWLDSHVCRCSVCRHGFAKIGTRCFTCFYDSMKSYLSSPPRCGICQRGYAKIRTHCLSCWLDSHACRCGVCRQGFAKIGSRCFKCFYEDVKSYLSTGPRCGICQQGYAKIGTRCLCCWLDCHVCRCGVCRQGFAKIGTRCFKCFYENVKSYWSSVPRCGICQRGYAKIGTRCFTCFKVHVTDFPRCGICQGGYAKVGSRCLICFKAHVTDYPRCGVCRVGYAKLGSRCFTCFKAHIANLRCGICQRGYAKIGSRCLTCHFALLRGSGRTVSGARVLVTRQATKQE